MTTSKKSKIDPKIAGSAETDEAPEDARKISGEAEARAPRIADHAEPRIADHAEQRDRLRGPERDQSPARSDGKTRKGYDGL